MPDEKMSSGMFGLLRDIISITGAFGRQYYMHPQFFRIRRIFLLNDGKISFYGFENVLARSISITYIQTCFAPCSV